MPLINEIGNVYNRLTVLERDYTKTNRAYWKCRCECGNIVSVDGYSLRSGHTKSCGCYQKEQTSKATTVNIIGKTIGNFTVLESIPGTKTNRHSWRCRCNLCGNENYKVVTADLYIRDSCGCQIESKGVRLIKAILEQNSINYIQEKRYSDLYFEDSKKQARYDFYLPKYNCLIEYDGRQHYKQGNGVYDNAEKFKKTQEHDRIKNLYAKNNNITLIRIPYTHYEKIIIEDLLPHSSTFIVQ